MLIRSNARLQRRGNIVSLLALSLVALLGFLALAIDVGMLAIAKTQAQNNADLAALTAARTLNGTSTNSYNSAAATSNAQAVMSYNYILGQQIQASQLTLTYGSYDYNQTTQAFNANYPPTSGVPWTAVSSTVVSTSTTGAFSSVFGIQFLPTVTGTAQAVHRPRDVALVMDLSASMRFGTLLGYDFWTTSRTTNNPDTLVPAFGHYSSSSAVLTWSGGNQTSSVDSYTLTPTNTTTTNSSYSLTYINSFYQNAAYASTLVRAFDSYTSTDNGNSWQAPASGVTPQLPASSYATTPGGDVPLFQSGSTTSYAQNLNQVLGNSSSNTAANILWELDGYSAYAGGKPDTNGTGGTPLVWSQTDYRANAKSPANASLPFNGYTQGPGYYGVTFFLWPPDPRNNQNTVGSTTLTGSTLQNYLAALGISNTKQAGQSQSDAATLAAAWSTWQTNGSAGLGYLQTWLTTAPGTGTVKINGVSYNKPFYNYATNAPTLVYVPTTSGNGTTATSGSWNGKWNGATVSSANMPSTYNAVCRLFNRAYPGGAAWTSTSFSADWRMRFFGTTNDNTVIHNSSGSLNPPGSSGMCSATQTYNAILSWLSTITNPSTGASVNPFPAMMRSGRIKYYGSMPTSITGSWPSYGGTDQQFWVEFMDHVLGFRQTSAGNYLDLSGASSSYPLIGYGADFTWGTETTNTIPTSTPQPYMNYTDNPARPLLRLWFSPILMVDYLHNCNLYENTSPYGAGLSTNWYFMQPGNSYEAPLYVQKQAYAAAITTMQTNHPNDWFTLISYSNPRQNSTDLTGRFNCVNAPLGTNYTYAQSALLFPFSTINADGSCNNTEVTPYDVDPSTAVTPSSNFVDIPRSGGDTSFAMGLMLAYNQFAVTPSSDTTLRTYVTSSPITFPTGMAGGLGRKGAQKVVIFETDGMANCRSSASLITNGSYNYYQIRYNMNNPGTSEYPSVTATAINDSTTLNQVYTLVQALNTQYSTSRNPFKLYALGFGPVFSGPDASTAETTLQTMQYYGNTQSSISTALSSSQIITGTDAQMSANMISAFTNILENGVQIALIQ